MVRRPAALLAASAGLTLAFLLLARVLPGPSGAGDANTLASAAPALLLLAACALSLLPFRDETLPLALLALGLGLVAAGLTEAGAVSGADVAKVFFAAALGMALARVIGEAPILVGVAIFVAAVDIASLIGGPTEHLAQGDSGASDFLSFYLPALGGGRAAQLGVVDVLFLGLFAAGAYRVGLRGRATAWALALSLPVVLVIQVAVDRALPTIPALALALLAVNADLIPRAVRAE